MTHVEARRTMSGLEFFRKMLAGEMPPPPMIDWAKIEIKATDLGNKTWMLAGQGGNITIAVGTDAIFACHALTAEESLARYVPTFAYEFNDENAPELFLPPAGFPYGAAHASELPYLFNPTTVQHPAGFSAAQQQLAAAMKQDWTNLAKTGIPAATWPRFAATSQRMLSLVPPAPQVETNFAAQHHCAFWAPEP